MARQLLDRLQNFRLDGAAASAEHGVHMARSGVYLALAFMHPAAAKFMSMPLEQQRAVHVRLLGQAATVWEQYCSSSTKLAYRESVTGTLQELDRHLPQEAIAAINERHDQAQVAMRYREPIVSLQDGDLKFPAPVESAYYAIYNAFRLHVLDAKIDPWLVVNQALAAVGQEHAVSVLEAAVSG